jgi:hypothetical protein
LRQIYELVQACSLNRKVSEQPATCPAYAGWLRQQGMKQKVTKCNDLGGFEEMPASRNLLQLKVFLNLSGGGTVRFSARKSAISNNTKYIDMQQKE